MVHESPEARAYALLQRTLILCAALVLGAMMIVFFYAAHASDSRCSDLQDMRAYVLGATNRAITNLPTLAYYKEHPDELAQALENLRQQRDEFKDPLDCSIF